MRIIGLTGSIASGKSTTARLLRRLSIPVFDSDAHVHTFLSPGGAATEILAPLYPDCVDEKGGMDRKKLGRLIFEEQPDLKPLLEGILHPLVREATSRFIQTHMRQRRRFCVIDIPLLFETKAQNRFDEIWCMLVPGFMQKNRLMRRSGMTYTRARAIIASQYPQRLKRQGSHRSLNSARGRNHIARELKAMIRAK